ncbi:hypothetical protein [Actinoplanes sp. NPDC049265]|uniref:hypothetical protein n=1 Tax=Actinoplanes sp. NPDC049265 TaxID=3363902 RepID=UPI00371287F0
MRRLIVAAVAVLTTLVLSPAIAEAHARECATPSIDRYQQWLASGEGTTLPATGSMLVPIHGSAFSPVKGGGGAADGEYAARIAFVGDEWHVAVLWLGNQFEAQVDLTRSAGFWLTYSATDDLWVQLRPASHWSGGAQWATAIPSTRGRLVTRFFSLRPEAWTSVPELGEPAHPYSVARGAARGLVFVGKTANRLDFRGLHVPRYTPPCL